MTIGFGWNAVPRGTEKAIIDVFRSGQYSPGVRVREFEEAFARLHKARHGVFVNSGTDALRLSLLALKERHGWPDGSLVAVPSLTFIATINVVLQAGLRPYFVDVGMTTFTMNPWNLMRRLETDAGQTPIRAVLPVHLFGRPCDSEIYEMAENRGWAVLEDSCETIGNGLKGGIGCYSTYMAHHVTTGVGGMALTNDTDLNYLIRSYANHGRNTDYLPGYFSKALSKELLKKRFQFDREGYSCRATEFQAVLGLSQMDGIEQNIKVRRLIWGRLMAALEGFDEFRFQALHERSTCMMFPVIIREGSDADKYDLCLALEKRGIETRDMMPVTNQPCMKKWVNEDEYSVAQWINHNGFYLPCHPGMTVKDVETIRDAVKEFFHGRIEAILTKTH